MASDGGDGPGKDTWTPGDRRLPEGRSSSRVLGPLRAEGSKGVAIAVASTVVVFAFLGLLIVNSPNWPVVKQAFFNGEIFVESFPEVAQKFVRNIWYFMIAEVVILPFALLLAVMRALRGPVFFPIRLLSIAYTDLFRGVPTILVIALFGFGIPALDLPGVPDSATFWAVVALILSYSAYVSEVYRAGIESVHPSQVAAARSLALTRLQALRFVIIPQAVRRVIPPLLNDFVALQKDTALVAFVVAVPEAFKESNIIQSATFNFTPYLCAAVLFLCITIPLTRLVDVLVARERSKRESGGTM